MRPTAGDVHRAHAHSSNHREEIGRSGWCGCFYCLEIFDSREIDSWTDSGTTAFCPYCGIDSVIGDASGFRVTPDFLAAMEARWFGLRAGDGGAQT